MSANNINIVNELLFYATHRILLNSHTNRFLQRIKSLQKAMKQLNISKSIFWVTFFSIAMGLLEAAVVVYLRAIYYPGGFEFPLVAMDYELAITEVFREAATLIMLLSVGVLAGRNLSTRFAYFLFSFAVWDIFYYIFLKAFLDWPQSLMTWDILFLIPVTWTGPVITPVITAVLMVVFALMIINFDRKNVNVRINAREWSLLIVGSLVLITAFVWDYSRFVLQHFSFSEFLQNINEPDIIALSIKYIPDSFNWWLFAGGELLIILGIVLFFMRTRKN